MRDDGIGKEGALASNGFGERVMYGISENMYCVVVELVSLAEGKW